MIFLALLLRVRPYLNKIDLFQNHSKSAVISIVLAPSVNEGEVERSLSMISRFLQPPQKRRGVEMTSTWVLKEVY